MKKGDILEKSKQKKKDLGEELGRTSERKTKRKKQKSKKKRNKKLEMGENTVKTENKSHFVKKNPDKQTIKK